MTADEVADPHVGNNEDGTRIVRIAGDCQFIL
jgi:hypothetical protein